MKSEKTRTQLDFRIRDNREKKASAFAEEILNAAGLLSAPIDPLEVAKQEYPQLQVKSGHFKDCFDGRLEYHALQDRFILFFNTKYDLSPHEHHSRTRFSIAHELGHFYLEHHRAYLMQGGRSHGSLSEFLSNGIIECEADAFAAGLLMPSQLLCKIINRQELTFDRIDEIAGVFGTSRVSTAIRSVQHSHFPCEVLGICEGRIAWRFRPNGSRDPLKEGGCYRQSNGPLRSKTAQMQWEAFKNGASGRDCHAGRPQDWFQLYGPATKTFAVWEHYLPVSSMATLVVLLTVSEEELFEREDELDLE